MHLGATGRVDGGRANVRGYPLRLCTRAESVCEPGPLLMAAMGPIYRRTCGHSLTIPLSFFFCRFHTIYLFFSLKKN